jgi:Uncharacterized conserved protein
MNMKIEEGDKCFVKFSGIEFMKSFNGAKDLATVEGDELTLKCNAKCDNFIDPDGKLSNHNAPILLTKIDNQSPFTFTSKVTPTFLDKYDSGALFIYLNKKWWFKFAFERDERKRTRAITVRTIETSDDNDHDIIDSTSMYMKISSDTKTIGFYYSLDTISWQLVRLFRNDYPNEIWIGFSTQSPMGNGTSSTFGECSFTQASITDFRMGV